MLKTSLNTNIILQIWKVANIVPIPHPTRQGHLIQAHIPPLRNCKDTGKEPYSLHDSKHTDLSRVQNTTLYSDGTTHSKQHRSKGVQPNDSLARTITVALDMSKPFDTISIHTLIRKLLQTNSQAQSLSSSQTTSMDAKPTQHIEITHRQLKTGVPQGGVLSPTLFNIYTADISPPVQVMTYADDMTITSTHTSTSAAKKYIQPYLQKGW